MIKKVKTVYICQVCKKEFATELECKKHEAEEMGLTLTEYEELEYLERRERELAIESEGCAREDNLRILYEKVMSKIVAFRNKHNLDTDGFLNHI